MRSLPVGNGTLTPRVPGWFAALMDALQVGGANTDALAEISDDEWKELLEFSDPAHLTLTLAQVKNFEFPEWVLDRLLRNVADNNTRFDRVRDTYIEAAAALDRAGVEHLVLKGFTQSPAFVRNPRLRLQSDLDLYCPGEQIVTARSALENIGYRPTGTSDYYKNADHLATMIRHGHWAWRGNAYDPAMPLSIELHFCLWNEPVSMIAVPEVRQFWERRVTRSIEDVSFPVMHPVDQIGYFALHILRGTLCGDWIVHHVLEMATFLHNHAQDDHLWSGWQRKHSAALRSRQAIAFSLAERWFSCNIHPAAREEMMALPLDQQAWIEKYGGSLLENMFRQNRDWVWLHIALLESVRKRGIALRRATIPSRVPKIGSIPITINRRQPSNLSNQYARYIMYIARQLSLRASLIPRVLWHGTVLWFSLRSFRGQFWAFLFAPFL